MISERIIEFLKESGWYDTTEDKSYEQALSDLEIALNTDFAVFNLSTNAMTFQGKTGSIYNVCWFYINSSYQEQIKAFQENFNLPKEYLPIDSFEAEGGYFYNKETGEVIELELGEKLTNFQKGIIDTKWDSFNDFLEWFFELT